MIAANGVIVNSYVNYKNIRRIIPRKFNLKFWWLSQNEMKSHFVCLFASKCFKRLAVMGRKYSLYSKKLETFAIRLFEKVLFMNLILCV